MSSCPSCRKTVQAGILGMRLDCGHWVHTNCLPKKDPDFDKCVACKGEVDLSTPLVDINEPLSFNGHDYVQNPVDRPSSSWFGQKKGDPFHWLAEKKPLEWIIQEKGFNLQRMLHAGVTMDDFVNNGYRWKDLKTFRDFADQNNTVRGREALFALKTNAEHFRDYLGTEVIQELGITGRHLVEMYGFMFPDGDISLRVVGGKNDRQWKAGELVSLGMKMSDLFGAGLDYIEQYADLEPTDQDEDALGVTDKDVEELKSLVPPQKRIVPKEKEERPQQQTVTINVVLPEMIVPKKPVSRRLHGLKKK